MALRRTGRPSDRRPLNEKLGNTIEVPSHFCGPCSSSQRETNENFNGRIRRYLPKDISVDNLAQKNLDEDVTEIDNRPRKVLGWLTSAEVFQELCSPGAVT